MMRFDFDFGAYALFVWGAYGLSAIAFAWMVVGSLSLSRAWSRKARQAQARLDEFQDGGATCA